MSGMGSRIASTRANRGINQSELARLVGVTSTAVWNWETHDRQPRSVTLDSVAKVLGVTREYLLTGKNGIGSITQKTVSEIVKQAQAEIAAAAGYEVDHVKVDVSFTRS